VNLLLFLGAAWLLTSVAVGLLIGRAATSNQPPDDDRPTATHRPPDTARSGDVGAPAP
jgi:hypothetical protein